MDGCHLVCKVNEHYRLDSPRPKSPLSVLFNDHSTWECSWGGTIALSLIVNWFVESNNLINAPVDTNSTFGEWSLGFGTGPEVPVGSETDCSSAWRRCV
jgi:hypothetical protein